MISIGLLGAGGAAAEYYLHRQAGCQLDYYTGRGELAGLWTVSYTHLTLPTNREV